MDEDGTGQDAGRGRGRGVNRIQTSKEQSGPCMYPSFSSRFVAIPFCSHRVPVPIWRSALSRPIPGSRSSRSVPVPVFIPVRRPAPFPSGVPFPSSPFLRPRSDGDGNPETGRDAGQGRDRSRPLLLPGFSHINFHSFWQRPDQNITHENYFCQITNSRICHCHPHAIKSAPLFTFFFAIQRRCHFVKLFK